MVILPMFSGSPATPLKICIDYVVCTAFPVPLLGLLILLWPCMVDLNNQRAGVRILILKITSPSGPPAHDTCCNNNISFHINFPSQYLKCILEHSEWFCFGLYCISHTNINKSSIYWFPVIYSKDSFNYKSTTSDTFAVNPAQPGSLVYIRIQAHTTWL